MLWHRVQSLPQKAGLLPPAQLALGIGSNCPTPGLKACPERSGRGQLYHQLTPAFPRLPVLPGSVMATPRSSD